MWCGPGSGRSRRSHRTTDNQRSEPYAKQLTHSVARARRLPPVLDPRARAGRGPMVRRRRGGNAQGRHQCRHLGRELNYWRIADTDFHGTSVSIRPSVWVPGPVQGVTEAQGVSVEGVLAWPFGQRLSVFAKGGLFFWDTVIKYFPTVSSQVTIENNQLTLINDNGVQPIFGAGVDVRLSRR